MIMMQTKMMINIENKELRFSQKAIKIEHNNKKETKIVSSSKKRVRGYNKIHLGKKKRKK